MIASMFSLDHRLAELRPTEAELRVARERRDAASRLVGIARVAGQTARHGLGKAAAVARPSSPSRA